MFRGLGAFGVQAAVDFRQRKRLTTLEMTVRQFSGRHGSQWGWVDRWLDDHGRSARCGAQRPVKVAIPLITSLMAGRSRPQRRGWTATFPLKAVDALNPWRKPTPEKPKLERKPLVGKLHEKALDSDGAQKPSKENLHSEARRATDDNDVLDDETLAYAKRLASEDLKGFISSSSLRRNSSRSGRLWYGFR